MIPTNKLMSFLISIELTNVFFICKCNVYAGIILYHYLNVGFLSVYFIKGNRIMRTNLLLGGNATG